MNRRDAIKTGVVGVGTLFVPKMSFGETAEEEKILADSYIDELEAMCESPEIVIGVMDEGQNCWKVIPSPQRYGKFELKEYQRVSWDEYRDKVDWHQKNLALYVPCKVNIPGYLHYNLEAHAQKVARTKRDAYLHYMIRCRKIICVQRHDIWKASEALKEL